MQRSLRIAAIVVGVLIVLALIGAGVWRGVQARSFPRARGTVELEGLSAPVEIYRDSYGVPHIYAQTREDMVFALGYIHAQDRFWQMEFWRRLGAGRLSEYFGESTVGTDSFLRTMGFYRIAEQEVAAMEPEMREVYDAYSQGVNAYILNRRPAQLGLEFALLEAQGVDVEIEPWTPANSLTWAKMMAYDLGGNMSTELQRLELLRTAGIDRTADLIPLFREDFPVIVPDEELERMDLPEPPTSDSALGPYRDINTNLVGNFDSSTSLVFGKGESIGSNNWVISGDLTDTGKPLLANDPHLAIQMPSIWYETAMQCVDSDGNIGRTPACPYNLRGYTFAGLPGIIIGHNDRIAWGVTNVGPDTQDLYIERLNPENPNQYEVNGEWVDMDIIHEEIRVNGQDEPVVITIRSTRHGPVITDLRSYQQHTTFAYDPEAGPEGLQFTALSLRWTALEPNTISRAIWLLDQATNYDEFYEAARYWDVAGQNIVYADVDGNIAYQMTGRIPIRAQGDGTLPVPGWTDDYEWTGYIPYEEQPRAYNPAQGYIATANQNVVSDRYPYLIDTEFDHGYRGMRINQMILADTDGISIADIQTMQGDNMNLSALEIVPYFKDIPLDDPALDAARDRLQDWDGQMHMDSPDAALFSYIWVELAAETFNDQLPQNLWPDAGSGRVMDAFYWLLQEPDNPWWDDITTTGTVETRDEILIRAVTQGYAAGVQSLGEDVDAWKWGDVHTALFANQTFGESGIALIEGIFNRGPVPASGGSSIVNATGWEDDEPFVLTSLPSMRQIIDLSDFSNSLMMHTTGQSGHPGHRHYDDFIDPWRLIEYHPTLWERAAVEEGSRDLLTLVPAE